MQKQKLLTPTRVLLLLALVVGAAVVIGSVLGARDTTGEGCVIADLRAVSSAEAAFASASGNLYGELSCLSRPARCLRDYTGPTFLDPGLGTLELRCGSVRTFHAGRAQTNQGLITSGFDGFCYGAMPRPREGLTEKLLERLGKPGSPSYGIDASGKLCQDPKGGDLCTFAQLPAHCTEWR